MQIVVLILLVLLNAFFAALEMAFISLNDARISMLAKEGNKKAKKIQNMLKSPSKFLATIQIGITFAGFLSSAFAADNFVEKLAPVLYGWVPAISLTIWKTISLVIITLILSFFTLIFGELVPKRIAMKFSEKVAFFGVDIIRFIAIITSPLVKFLTWSTNVVSKLFGIGENEEEIITEEEIRMMVDEGEEKGTIKDTEKEMINNVFEFNDRVVSEIMVNRTEVFAVDMNMTIAELDELLQQEGYRYSRVPVYNETIDNIQGILYVKDILKEYRNTDKKIESLIRDGLFVLETRTIDEVFKDMQQNKVQIAIVLDEYGGTAGIVTMEDVLEEIVGDIYDEYDETEFEYEKIDENTFRFDGTISVYSVNKIMQIELPEGDYDTLSGFILNQIERIPDEGELPTVETDQAVFKVEKYENRKIELVKACRTQKIEEDENDTI